jgi:hypothetical protein
MISYIESSPFSDCDDVWTADCRLRRVHCQRMRGACNYFRILLLSVMIPESAEARRSS